MKLKKILIPLDGSKRSLDSIEMAKSLFKDSDTEIYLLHVTNMEYVFEENLQRQVADLSYQIVNEAARNLDSYNISKKVLSGIAYKEIVEYAERENFDLIIMSRTGLSGLRKYLVGSVTNKVISRTTVPILIVPEKEGKETDFKNE